MCVIQMLHDLRSPFRSSCDIAVIPGGDDVLALEVTEVIIQFLAQRLILVTDGITERQMQGGGRFGVAGLREAVQRAEDPTAASTAMAIQQAITDCWREPLEDDATVLVSGKPVKTIGAPARARRAPPTRSSWSADSQPAIHNPTMIEKPMLTE